MSLRANFDTLDDASFPRRGFYFDGSVTYDFNPQGSIGEPDSNTRYEVKAAIPLQLGERTTALVSGRAAAANTGVAAALSMNTAASARAINRLAFIA